MRGASALMIHNAWVRYVTGNGAQLRQEADVLDKISKAAGNAYAEKVTISREELDNLLDGDNHEGTWILPDDAVTMGFATSISSEQESSVANQSAMHLILQKVTEKPMAQASLDTDKLADVIVNKLTEKVKSTQPTEPQENKPLKFLSALMR